MNYDTGLQPGHIETIEINGEAHDTVNTPSTPRAGYSNMTIDEWDIDPRVSFSWDTPLARYIESGALRVPRRLESYFLKL